MRERRDTCWTRAARQRGIGEKHHATKGFAAYRSTVEFFSRESRRIAALPRSKPSLP
jgi:hypothetical protein